MKAATGKVIKALRKHLDYKQDFVSKKLNITPTTLANIENGRVGIDMEKLYLLGKIFGVPPKTIFELAIAVYETNTDDWLNNAVKSLKE
jgi:transcriptional regulator with XRE-family HTH domain